MRLQYLHQGRGDFWMWWVTTPIVAILAISFAVGMWISFSSDHHWIGALLSTGFILVAAYFFKSWHQTVDFTEEVIKVVGINWQLLKTGTHYAPWPFAYVPEAYYADLRPFSITAFPTPQLIEAKGGRVILDPCEIKLRVTDTLLALFSMGGTATMTGPQYLQQVFFPLLYQDVVDSIIGKMDIALALDLSGQDIQGQVNDAVRATCAEHGYTPMGFLLGNPDEGAETKAVKTRELNENMWWTLFRMRLKTAAGVPEAFDNNLIVRALDSNEATWTPGNRYYVWMDAKFREVLSDMIRIYTVSTLGSMENLTFLGALPGLLGGLLGTPAASSTGAPASSPGTGAPASSSGSTGTPASSSGTGRRSRGSRRRRAGSP